MFYIDNSVEKSLQDAQSLLERATSRSLNQSVTLLTDETQRIPTRIPPINHQISVQDSHAPRQNASYALEETASVLDTTLSKFRAETVKVSLDEKNLKGTEEHDTKISVATSPAKPVNAMDRKDALNFVIFTYLRIAARIN